MKKCLKPKYLAKSISKLSFSFLFLCISMPFLGHSQVHSIVGFDPMCPNSTSTYRVDPYYDGDCDSYSWSVTNGQIIGSTNAQIVSVEWDPGKTQGTISYDFKNCLHGPNDYPTRKASLTVDLWDFSLLRIETDFMSTLPNCNTEVITLNLDHNVLDVDQVNNITWSAPSGWTIQPNSQAGGSIITNNFGKHFKNVKINTNLDFSSPKTVSVTFDSPSFNGGGYCGSQTITKTITFEVNACRPHITYPSEPSHHQSHSRLSTTMDGSITMSSGQVYNYVSGGVVDMLPSFEIVADADTDFNAFIESCSCSSPYMDPNLMGFTNVTRGPTSNKRKNDHYTTISNQSDAGSDYGILIYPNPFNHYIEVAGLPSTLKNEDIQLMDASGRVIKLEILNPASDGVFRLLMPQNLGSGIYYLQIIEGETKRTFLVSKV